MAGRGVQHAKTFDKVSEQASIPSHSLDSLAGARSAYTRAHSTRASHCVPRTHTQGAPTTYVAGLGRGAVGFTTRSDIGPARSVPEVSFGQAPPGYVAGRGRGMGDLARSQQEGGFAAGGAGRGGGGERGDVGDYSESNYDEFSGYGGALFGGETPYDDDDREADKIYQAIDDRMDMRRKRRREEKLLETLQKVRAQRPKAGDQFADLKADLQNVSVVSFEFVGWFII